MSRLVPVSRREMSGRRQGESVLLPVEEWEQAVDELEELEDIRACNEAETGPTVV